MQAVNHVTNNVVKWSLFITGMAGLAALTGVFVTWLMIELLVLLTGITI